MAGTRVGICLTSHSCKPFQPEEWSIAESVHGLAVFASVDDPPCNGNLGDLLEHKELHYNADTYLLVYAQVSDLSLKRLPAS